MNAARQILHTARTAPVFAAAVTLAIAAAGFNGFMVLLMALGLEDFLPGPLAHMGHFTEPHHRTHDVTFAVLFVPAVLGLLAQLRRPRRHVAGMLMSLIPAAALTVVLLLTAVLAGDTRVLQPPG